MCFATVDKLEAAVLLIFLLRSRSAASLWISAFASFINIGNGPTALVRPFFKMRLSIAFEKG